MVKKPTSKRPIPVNLELLSKEDRAALTEQARASVLETMSQDARDDFFQSEMERLRREQVPDEQIVSVTMDMAPYLPHIMIDQVQYFHGYIYDVPVTRARVLYEQMQRSWHHQDEIDGRGRTEAYRRPTNRTLGPSHAGTPTRGANGVVTAEL